ncbi:hypothetical protein NKH18_01765 [Streptomyces sp. M10(2022)]
MTTTLFISRKGLTRRSMLGAALAAGAAVPLAAGAAVPLAAVAGPRGPIRPRPPRRDAAHAARADRAAPGGHGPAAPRRPVASGRHRGPRHFRELMATVWYPARNVQRYPVAPWMPAGALQAFLADAGFSDLALWGRSLPATWALRCGDRADGCPSSCSRTARAATRATTPSWSKSSPAMDMPL